MTTDRLPYFLSLARDWMAVADALRAAGSPAADAARRVWREAAWCHVLFARGRADVALASLRAIVGTVTGGPPAPDAGAAALFDALRAAAVSAYPSASARPHA